jgi:hypothetical protein
MSISSGTDGTKMERMAQKWNGWQENGTDGNEIELSFGGHLPRVIR